MIRPELVAPGSNYEEPPNGDLSTCIRCGAVVAIRNQDVHDGWHDQIGDVLEKIVALLDGDGR